jgi:glucan phosphoethanolaminetransferase (alkaline phosphatase superfamily)
MENIEIINLWKQYDEKLEKSLSLNQKIISELQQQKAKNALKPARNYKYVAVVVGLAYAALIAYFLYHLNSFANIFINISVGIHLLVTLIAVAMYIKQLVLINQIDCSENILQMQQKMAKLQSSSLRVIGICFLQFPVFATWNFRIELIDKNPLEFWLIQVPITLLLTYIGVWFYKNINIKNMDKRWFRILFCGSEWNSIIKSGKFLKEIETFEKG